MKPPIIDRLEQDLDNLMSADASPTIAVNEVAAYLGIDPMCIRQMAYNNSCPWAFGYKGDGNGYARVSKLALYRWLMK